MFEFKRDKYTLSIIISHFIPYAGNWTTELSTTYSNQHHAALAFNLLKEQFESKVREAKKEAYEKGWKDAKSKNTKQDWFSCQLD